MINQGNSGQGNKEERDDWETPKLLFDLLNKQYNFGFDCCANNKNNKCIGFTDNFNGCPLDCIKWMNPPFSKSKEMFEIFFKFVDKGIAIYRCDNMETKIWQEIILKNADWIFIPSKRIIFEHHSRKSNGVRFPSALIGIGVKKILNVNGITLNLKK